jgi:hypothetical protein
MTNLTVVRDSGYADRLRAYKIMLDGVVIGTIRNGETKTFPIIPGSHSLSLKIDWCGSKPVKFTAADSTSVAFDAKSNLRGPKILGALWRSVFAWNSWLLLEQRTSDSQSGG